ncbi:MAG: YceI family protein [Bacteroidetes bacterium]|nr:YceI family protein [Bacteroidota bacterium]
MKVQLLSALAFSALVLASCGETKEEVKTEGSVTAGTYTADAAASKVNWKGEVAGVYGHQGFVNLKSGSVTFNDSALTGGEFVVDMSVISPTDSASYKDEEGHRITDLQKHLTTKDFFATDSFPTATFVITSVEGSTVKGNLTVRGKTNEESAEILSSQVVDGVATITGKLVFNRQKYDVAWVHFMKDMVLSNDIAIDFTLVAKK